MTGWIQVLDFKQATLQDELWQNYMTNNFPGWPQISSRAAGEIMEKFNEALRGLYYAKPPRNKSADLNVDFAWSRLGQGMINRWATTQASRRVDPLRDRNAFKRFAMGSDDGSIELWDKLSAYEQDLIMKKFNEVLSSQVPESQNQQSRLRSSSLSRFF